jgi:hypothetical protein
MMKGDRSHSRFEKPKKGATGMTLLWILLAIAYIALFFWLGLTTLRNGHGWLFFFGIFFPILWIVGAFMPGPNDVEVAPPTR